MKMFRYTKTTLWLSCLLLFCSSCEDILFREGQPCTVTFFTYKTKMTGTEESFESGIVQLQGFSFRPEGNIESYSRSSGNTLSLECTTGQRDLYIVANLPLLDHIKTKAELDAEIVRLSALTTEGIPMLYSAATWT